jgi:hypothetical protein
MVLPMPGFMNTLLVTDSCAVVLDGVVLQVLQVPKVVGKSPSYSGFRP